MGMPVKLSDDLVSAARTEARSADRSITGQIEHWAKLGKAVERFLDGSVVRLLKIDSAGDSGMDPGDDLRTHVLAALERLTVDPDRQAAHRLIAAEAHAIYETDSLRGGVVRVAPDGSRTPGRFRGKTFVPSRSRTGK